MEETLQNFLSTSTYAFILTFVRLGTAVMIMPGIGDSFVSQKIRLLIALAMSFVLMPITSAYIPANIPGTMGLLTIVMGEAVIGLFFGTIARIFMMATDTAGMVVSISSGLGNAQIFNPSLATQGSLLGAFMSITGVAVLFSVDLHHLVISAIIDSYNSFPVDQYADTASMAQMVAKTVSASFAVGIKMAAPFIVLTLIIYVGMGVLSRIMPQMQVFLIALPLQILLSLIVLALTVFAMFAYWIGQFEQGMIFMLSMPGE